MKDHKNFFLDEFDLMSKQGVLGLFDHFEIYEIVQYKCKCNTPNNVFTIAIAVENGKRTKPTFLNEKRIVLKGLPSSRFGVSRSVIDVSEFRYALTQILTTGSWKPNGSSIDVGELHPTLKRFSPPDATEVVPLNRVLKNNFFNGSYTLELFDIEKLSFASFQQHPSILQDLSAQICRFVPIKIGSLSDRLGNIVIQFPIDAIRSNFATDGINYQVEIAWNPKIPSRKLVATGQTEYDRSLISFGKKEIWSGTASLGIDPKHGSFSGIVWDPENDLVLAATGELSFFNSASLNLSIGIQEPRIIPRNINDRSTTQRIKLFSPPQLNNITALPNASTVTPISGRIYAEDLSSLSDRRKFVQYGSHQQSATSDRLRALLDVRNLISSHGANGVWLWDPYLSPQDLLDTLFYNPVSGAPMRALTALKQYSTEAQPGSKNFKSSRLNKQLRVLNANVGKKESWLKNRPKETLIESYREHLSTLPSNFYGLKIEFRSAHGQNGCAFHDRFLIFPKAREAHAKAWSLGTSINSLGKSHHILQQVDNAQLISDAFQALWDLVDRPDSLIWETP